jgi:hypothetical protein
MNCDAYTLSVRSARWRREPYEQVVEFPADDADLDEPYVPDVPCSPSYADDRQDSLRLERGYA